MLRPVVRMYDPHNGPDNPSSVLGVTMVLKCGHIVRRPYTPGHLWARVHCPMCSYRQKEWDRHEVERAAKRSKKEMKRQRNRKRVEAEMAKKASPKVVKKADLKKKKVKKATKKNGKVRRGRGWHMPLKPVAPNEIVKQVLTAFAEADDRTIYENELLALIEKGGVKPEGKKTVKKLLRGVIRNMSRAGLIVKQRGRKKEDEDEEEAAVEDEEEVDETETEGTETEEEDDEGDGDDVEEEDEAVVETPKKKVIKKIKKGKK